MLDFDLLEKQIKTGLQKYEVTLPEYKKALREISRKRKTENFIKYCCVWLIPLITVFTDAIPSLKKGEMPYLFLTITIAAWFVSGALYIYYKRFDEIEKEILNHCIENKSCYRGKIVDKNSEDTENGNIYSFVFENGNYIYISEIEYKLFEVDDYLTAFVFESSDNTRKAIKIMKM